MTVLLASLLGGCVDSPPPDRPRPSRFDQPEVPQPEPVAGEPAPESDATDPDASDPDTPDEPPGIRLGDAGPIPEITQDDRNRWRKTGGRSDVSQPEFPPPIITPDQCEELPNGGPVEDPAGCVTATIECEGRVIGHTEGGVDLYTTKFYEKKKCWPATKDHDGGNERIYKLVMPEGEWRAWATLYTPCADLDLAAVRYDHGGCPTISNLTGACEMTVNEGTYAERIELTSQTKRRGERPVWYIIVEGKDDAEGLFELDVQCRPGVGGSVDP